MKQGKLYESVLTVRDKLNGINHERVMVIDNTGLTQWPVLYSDGTVGYEFPEHISQTKKNKARRLLIKLGRAIKIARERYPPEDGWVTTPTTKGRGLL